jgi:hypothetical protein
MFTRRTLTCALVCALLSCAISVAPAAASQRSHKIAPQAQYYASFGKSDASGQPTRTAADPQARYYASYGHPEPLTPAHQPAPSDNDTPWLLMTLIVAAALAVVATGVTLASRTRRHTPRVAA